MIDLLIEFILRIWHADSEIRDRSILGESELEKKDRNYAAAICVGLILMVLIGGLVWYWCGSDMT